MLCHIKAILNVALPPWEGNVCPDVWRRMINNQYYLQNLNDKPVRVSVNRNS